MRPVNPHFLHSSHPILKTRAHEIPLHEIPLQSIQAIIEQMHEIAQTERVDPSKKSMLGLAAPQIGISKRIILVDMDFDREKKAFSPFHIFINPEITWKSSQQVWDKESCVSVDSRIIGIVPRHETIQFIAYDRHGNPISREITGFSARIFQHQVDHLDGICFPDRVGEEGVLHWVEQEEYSSYKRDWQSWPIKCSWDKWIDAKEGKL